jgi:selenocysteine-specific elongation factor
LELEKPLLASENALIIASKLDSDLEANVCRIAFYGHIIATY